MVSGFQPLELRGKPPTLHAVTMAAGSVYWRIHVLAGLS